MKMNHHLNFKVEVFAEGKMKYQSKISEIITGEIFKRTDQNNFTKFNLVQGKVIFRDKLFNSLSAKEVSGVRIFLQC